ncbi:MAG: DUF1648 domain-containing protein [Leifsonia sp.]
MSTASGIRPDEARTLRLVTVWVPVVVVLLTVGLILSWLPRLPDPVATHWGPGGEADAFGSPWVSIGALVGISALFIAVMALSLAASIRRGRIAPAALRPTAALAPAVTVLLCVITAGTLAIQVDAESATDASGIGWIIGGGIAAAILTGLGAWFVLPSRAADAASAPTPESPVVVAPGERLVWTRRASTARGLIAVPLVLAVVAFIPVLVDPSAWWITALILAVDVLASLTLVARVTVDARGLTVRALLGIRLLHVPIAAVASASVVDVDAFGEFGGWGVRMDATGRRGVVLASGEALQVQRVSGAPVLVAVEDARTGAAVLAGLAAAAHTAPPVVD